ncbi:MAG: Fur family transcriptional regulator [Helicobacteraceae bacterium]
MQFIILSPMQNAKEIFKIAGIKYSEQKEKIYLAIAKTQGLFMASDLCCALEPAVNRATVFRVLNQFCAAGLLNEISHTKRTRYFELPRKNHAHFFCTRCNKIECVPVPDLSNLQSRRILEVSLRGICGACKENSSKTKGKK